MTEEQAQLHSVLSLYMEEHYAHARDHEHLRGQITAILTASAMVFVGLAFDKQVQKEFAIIAGIASILLGSVNAWLILLHSQLFDKHVKTAREARRRLTMMALGENWADLSATPTVDPCRIVSGVEVWGPLRWSWMLVPAVPVTIGLFLLIRAFC